MTETLKMTNFRIRDHAPSFVITAKETMAFIIKKKRYKFSVDLTLNELTQIAFGKAILFAKRRIVWSASSLSVVSVGAAST